MRMYTNLDFRIQGIEFAYRNVRCHSEKLKDRDLFAEKSLTNCPLFDIDRLFGFDRLLTSDNFFERTIPRRL